MRVLVVGGSGYIGGGVVDLLLEGGHDVRVFDALLYEEVYRKPVPFTFGDVRDAGALTPHLRWAECVIWLAALVGDGACALNPDVAETINHESVRWLSQNYDGRIIFMSTCSVYGAQDTELDETSPTNPLSIYAVTKLEAEAELAKKNAIIFRLGTVFGVGDLYSRIRLDLVVNVLVVRAFTEGKVRVFGGAQFRPLLHVKDAAHAVVENIATPHRGIYNLHRQNVRIVDLAYQVRNHFPDLTIEQTEMAFQDARNYRVKSDKAVTTLAFRPRYSIDHGIEEVKALVEQHRIRDLDNPRFTNQSFLAKFGTHLV